MKWMIEARKLCGKTRRSPCGERGLKLLALRLSNGLTQSLPVRGAWVEMPKRSA